MVAAREKRIGGHHRQYESSPGTEPVIEPLPPADKQQRRSENAGTIPLGAIPGRVLCMDPIAQVA